MMKFLINLILGDSQSRYYNSDIKETRLVAAENILLAYLRFRSRAYELANFRTPEILSGTRPLQPQLIPPDLNSK